MLTASRAKELSKAALSDSVERARGVFRTHTLPKIRQAAMHGQEDVTIRYAHRGPYFQSELVAEARRLGYEAHYLPDDSGIWIGWRNA